MFGSRSETLVTLAGLAFLLAVAAGLVLNPTAVVPVASAMALANLALILRICLSGGNI